MMPSGAPDQTPPPQETQEVFHGRSWEVPFLNNLVNVSDQIRDALASELIKQKAGGFGVDDELTALIHAYDRVRATRA